MYDNACIKRANACVCVRERERERESERERHFLSDFLSIIIRGDVFYRSQFFASNRSRVIFCRCLFNKERRRGGP